MKITFEQTGEREVQGCVRGRPEDPEVTRILAALQALDGASSKLLLGKPGQSREYLLDPERVDYLAAQDGKVAVYAGGETYESRQRLYELKDALHGKGFVQISKGVVVNVNAVQAVEAEFSGNYVAQMRDGRTRLVISRSYMKAFRTYIMEGK